MRSQQLMRAAQQTRIDFACIYTTNTHTYIQNQYLVWHSAAGAFILRRKNAKIAQENNINSICRVCHLHANKKQTLYKPNDL